MYNLHILHLRLRSRQPLSAELLLASISRKRFASSQRHVSHAVRDLFNHVYLFFSTTRTDRGVSRGSGARYSRLLVNRIKVLLLVSKCGEMFPNAHRVSHVIWDRTWQKGLILGINEVELIQGSKDGITDGAKAQFTPHKPLGENRKTLSLLKSCDTSLTPSTGNLTAVPRLPAEERKQRVKTIKWNMSRLKNSLFSKQTMKCLSREYRPSLSNRTISDVMSRSRVWIGRDNGRFVATQTELQNSSWPLRLWGSCFWGARGGDN